MRMARSIIKISVLILLIIGARWASKEIQMKPHTSSGREPIFSAEKDDYEMNMAMQKARDSFGQFWAVVSEDYRRVIPIYTNAMVKASFSDPLNPTIVEHMWISSIEYDGKAITGTLESTPDKIKSFSTGDQVRFSLSQVSDWIYEEDGIAQGAYTVKLLRQRMSEKDRIQHDRHYPFRFE